MNNKKLFISCYSLCLMIFSPSYVYAHDTTHIHPLITDKIADLIYKIDKNTHAYDDIHKQDPDKTPVDGMDQRLY